MVSTNTMSRSRLRRWATEPNTSAAISSRASSRKSIAAYAASSVNPGQRSIATRSATQPVAASFDPGSHARCADQREHHPLHRVAVQAPPGGDPADRRADPEAFPDPVQRPRRTQPAGVQHLDPTAGLTGAHARWSR